MPTTIEQKKILFGLGWTTLSTITVGLSQILRLAILARFLTKDDFGIVAILTFVMGFTYVFSDLGLSVAVMAERKLSREQFLNLYWTQFFVFNFIYLFAALCSPIIALYYKASCLTSLLPITLLELFFISIGRLYDTVLQKELQFKIISIRNITSSILSLCVAIILAWLGSGIYSLILSTLFYAAMVNIWNLIAGQAQYKLAFRMPQIRKSRELIRIGIYQMGTQILDYVSSKMDILIISIFFNMSMLGIYNLAKELVLKIVIVITSIVNKVLLPVLSERQDNPKELKRMFKSFLSKISLFSTPLTAFVYIFSPLIVNIFYGKEYAEAYDIVSIMAVWSLFVILVQPNGLVALAMKRTDITFRYTIIRLFIMGLLLLLFSRYSLQTAAYTMLGSYLIMMFVNWKMILHTTIKMSLKEYLATLKPTWTALLIMPFIQFIAKKFILC